MNSTYAPMPARNGRGPAVRRKASSIAMTNPSANAPSDRRMVSHAPATSCGRWSQTMPNWKAYFIAAHPRHVRVPRGTQDTGKFVVSALQIEIARAHRRRVVSGADCELVLDLRLGISVADRFRGERGHAGGIHLTGDHRLHCRG